MDSAFLDKFYLNQKMVGIILLCPNKLQLELWLFWFMISFSENGVRKPFLNFNIWNQFLNNRMPLMKNTEWNSEWVSWMKNSFVRNPRRSLNLLLRVLGKFSASWGIFKRMTEEKIRLKFKILNQFLKYYLFFVFLL